MSRKFWPESEILGIFSIEVAPKQATHKEATPGRHISVFINAPYDLNNFGFWTQNLTIFLNKTGASCLEADQKQC